MACIKKYFVCPVCEKKFDNQTGAVQCRNAHKIRSELWAVGTEKAVRILDNCAPGFRGSVEAALIEADLSDSIEKRKRQLDKIKQEKAN